MNQQKAPAGCVSNGTLRPQDLLRSFADVVESHYSTLAPSWRAQIVDEARALADDIEAGDKDSQSDDVFCRVEHLAELLHQIAPEGHYFGTLEGDEACFGFWPTEEDED